MNNFVYQHTFFSPNTAEEITTFRKCLSHFVYELRVGTAFSGKLLPKLGRPKVLYNNNMEIHMCDVQSVSTLDDFSKLEVQEKHLRVRGATLASGLHFPHLTLHLSPVSDLLLSFYCACLGMEEMFIF